MVFSWCNGHGLRKFTQPNTGKLQWSSGPWIDFVTVDHRAVNLIDFEPVFFWPLYLHLQIIPTIQNIILLLFYNVVRHAHVDQKISNVNRAELPHMEGMSQEFPTQMAVILLDCDRCCHAWVCLPFLRIAEVAVGQREYIYLGIHIFL